MVASGTDGTHCGAASACLEKAQSLEEEEEEGSCLFFLPLLPFFFFRFECYCRERAVDGWGAIRPGGRTGGLGAR